MARNYFPHDALASKQDKLVALRMETGAEGYGVYWLIMETLFNSPEGVMPLDYNILGWELHLSSTIMKRVVESFDLFTIEDTPQGRVFYSPQLQQHIETLQQISERRSTAGKKGGRPSKNENSQPSENQDQQKQLLFLEKQNKSNCFQNEKQINKIKEIKEIKEINKSIDNAHDRPTDRPPEDIDEENSALSKIDDSKTSPPAAPVLPAYVAVEIETLVEEHLKLASEGSEWFENLRRRFGIDADNAQKRLRQFATHLAAKDEPRKTRTDFRTHFDNWLRIVEADEKRRAARSKATAAAAERLKVAKEGDGSMVADNLSF